MPRQPAAVIANALHPSRHVGAYHPAEPPGLPAEITVRWSTGTTTTEHGWVTGWRETGTGDSRRVTGYHVEWYSGMSHRHAWMPPDAVRRET